MRQLTWRRAVRAVELGLSLGLLVLVAGLAVVLIVIPKATGSTPLTVLTQSMEPRLPPGTLLVVRPVAAEDIRIGDVVTYQIASGRPEVVSHRVIAITSGSDGTRAFVFRGDANAEPDPNPVVPAQIRGRVWYSLPLVGYVNQVVNGERGWLVPLLAGLLIAYGAVMVGLGTASSVRRRRAVALGAEAGSLLVSSSAPHGNEEPTEKRGANPERLRRRHRHRHRAVPAGR